MKILQNQLHLFKDDLKVKDFSHKSWKTEKDWRNLHHKVPKDGEECSEISFYAPTKNHHKDEFILRENRKGIVSVKQKLIVLKLFHESQLRDAIREDICDLSTFSDADFYDIGMFRTVSNVIATYENHEQEMFNVSVWHKLQATSEEIEYNILENIVMRDINTRENAKQNPFNLNEDGTLKNGVAEDLVKISICTYWMDKLEERESDKVKEMSERTGGKFYFQPDQRCKTVDSLIEKYPLVASEVLSYSDWCKREGFTMPTIKECA